MRYVLHSFFLPSIMTGPSFTYRAYAAYTDRSLFANRKGSVNSLGLPTGRWRKAGKRAAIGGFYLAIFAVYGYKYSYERMLDPGFGKRGFLQGCVKCVQSSLTPRIRADYWRLGSQRRLRPAGWPSGADQVLCSLVIRVSLTRLVPCAGSY